MPKHPKVTGTKEWAAKTANWMLGCHGLCGYCFAREQAVRFGRCPSFDAWGTSYYQVRTQEVRRKRRRVPGRIMCPSTHDIPYEFIDEALEVLTNLLKADNQLTIVSKPNLPSIIKLCRELGPFRNQILFRFTIGALTPSILDFWEPGAPPLEERLDCLRFAFEQGFATSVSCEPMLEVPRMVELYHAVDRWVNHTVWFGKMNRIRQRVQPGMDPREVARVEGQQSTGAIRGLHVALGEYPKVRWKESCKKDLGIPLAQECGLDV